MTDLFFNDIIKLLRPNQVSLLHHTLTVLLFLLLLSRMTVCLPGTMTNTFSFSTLSLVSFYRTWRHLVVDLSLSCSKMSWVSPTSLLTVRLNLRLCLSSSGQVIRVTHPCFVTVLWRVMPKLLLIMFQLLSSFEGHQDRAMKRWSNKFCWFFSGLGDIASLAGGDGPSRPPYVRTAG